MTPPLSPHLSDDQLTLLYFGEPTAPELHTHVAACPDCQGRFQALATLLDAVRAVPVPEKAASWEDRVWTGLAPHVRAELGRSRSRLHAGWSRLWLLGPALAGLLAVAFLAGMYTQHRVAKTAAGFSSHARQRVLLIALGDHFDRSQIVLAELMNAPEDQPYDLSAEQRLTAGLLSENRLLRQTALRTGDHSDASVLDDLERVLLEVAHAPSEVSPAELNQIRERIAAQGLLFKVRVIGANARERGRKL